MDEQNAEIPYLENVGIFLTYKCQVACPHCLVKAGPHRSEVMPEENYCNWISQAAEYGGRVRSINFTGGEPFYDLNLFRKMCRFAMSKGLFPTSVTNAYWAETFDGAVEILQSVPELLFLQISADEHHQKRIPMERIENAVRAAQKLELVHQVAVCTDNEESPAYREMMNRLLKFMDQKHIITVITFPAGRATLFQGKMEYKITNIPPAGACGGAGNPVIFPDGSVQSCIGPVIDIKVKHPLLLGNLHDSSLREILDAAESNAVLHFIRTWGPSKIYELLEEDGRGARLRNAFVEGNICILCRDLMADPESRTEIAKLFEDRELIETVAYGRDRYLKEPEMLQRLGLERI